MSPRNTRAKRKCAYCGVNPADSRDHVFPRELWGRNPPSKLQLPTVPACDSCNQGISGDEEYFRLMVSSGLAYEHPVVRLDTWPGPIRRMLKKSPRLRAALISTAQPALLELPSGDVVKTLSLGYDRVRIGRVLEKMARGAYYLDLHRPLPRKARVRTYSGIPKSLEPWVAQFQELNLAGGILKARRGYDDKQSSFMLCWFQFYDDKSFTILAQSQSAWYTEDRSLRPPESVRALGGPWPLASTSSQSQVFSKPEPLIANSPRGSLACGPAAVTLNEDVEGLATPQAKSPSAAQPCLTSPKIVPFIKVAAYRCFFNSSITLSSLARSKPSSTARSTSCWISVSLPRRA